MNKEYPFRGKSDEEVIDIMFAESARAISSRGRNFFVGFSFVKDGVNRNFVTPAIWRGEDALYPLLTKLRSKLAEENELAKKNDTPISALGWFIGEPKDIEKLVPHQTTFLK